MNHAKRLRELINSNHMIKAPGAPDAYTAKLIENAGFDVCYMGGNAAVASMLGIPDIGLATFDDMLRHGRNIAAAIDIPLICDADTGYGNVNNVIRTVQLFEQAGVAGIHLEDQVTPKKCGAMDGVEVISIEESVKKIQAAIHARKNDDFLIIARTDSRSALGFEEAIKRVKAFEKAGADMVYIEMLQSKSEIKELVEAVNIPVVYDVLEPDHDKHVSAEELREIGVKLAIYPLFSSFLIGKTLKDFFTELYETESPVNYFDRMLSLKEYEGIMGVDGEVEVRKRFG
ncbi:oxaloacetate decarboxylase [Oceanobacillus sojae]|uniref:isocitrate lyase/PEP mutase family protein n=1 Tax=Oceanobacillus sojae TaxID=582851 RepID=UPI0021A40697|nr:isocitrate lyase/PEP mutase family protein [Oceanobacillus sojae]MCT1901869.1 isocitrate lyase/PEP mutase family protein [Oceanobacillus sojae]